MFPRVFLALFLIACLGGTCRAENKKKEEAIIVEISPVELTVERGHEAHATYEIPKDAIICLNGLPATAFDLRAGMMVTIRTDSTKKVALAIRAHKPPHGR